MQEEMLTQRSPSSYKLASNSLVLEDPGEEGLLGHEDELAGVVLDQEDGYVPGLGALAVHGR